MDGSCYSPIDLKEEKTIVDESFYDKLDLYDAAKYLIPAVVGGIAIGEIKRRKMVNKDKRYNKWEELDATAEIEANLDYESLTRLAEDTFDQD